MYKTSFLYFWRGVANKWQMGPPFPSSQDILRNLNFRSLPQHCEVGMLGGHGIQVIHLHCFDHVLLSCDCDLRTVLIQHFIANKNVSGVRTSSCAVGFFPIKIVFWDSAEKFGIFPENYYICMNSHIFTEVPLPYEMGWIRISTSRLKGNLNIMPWAHCGGLDSASNLGRLLQI